MLPARLEVRDGAVWMEKVCPEHGFQKARIHGDARAYAELGRFHRPAVVPGAFATDWRGCPDSCGLCPEHEQHVCLPIVEITDHCNLRCPICLVTNPGRRHLAPAELGPMLDRLVAAEGQIDVLNLSGGEPTVHPEFRDIVRICARRPEILRVSVSTNGVRLAQDPDLLGFLAANRVVVSLQFDGLDDAIHQALRGRPLLDAKLELIDRCAAAGVAMSLTATVVRGVNDTALAGIADLLFARDHILSAMFQPAAYAGEAAKLGRPPDAVTIPDVVAALAGSGRGAVRPSDFSPLPCSHPACFALAFYLRVNPGEFVPIKRLVSPERYLSMIRNRALFGTDAEGFERVTEAVYDLWAAAPVPPAEGPDAAGLGAPGECAPGSGCACSPFLSEKALRAVRSILTTATASGYAPGRALAAAERSVKSIFIHQFMDPDSFDLARARQCCQVYPQADGRLIPACVRNCVPGFAPTHQPSAFGERVSPRLQGRVGRTVHGPGACSAEHRHSRCEP
jgi:uncharacterized radical SAM superfamily Fe-S cluster-containing enzyme